MICMTALQRVAFDRRVCFAKEFVRACASMAQLLSCGLQALHVTCMDAFLACFQIRRT